MDLNLLANQLYEEMFHRSLNVPVEFLETRWLGEVCSRLERTTNERIPTKIVINKSLKDSDKLEFILRHELIHVYLIKTENHAGHGCSFRKLADKWGLVSISPKGRKLYATLYPQAL
jgi:hypothetical protein